MTVRGPNSLKPLLNSTPESNAASPSQFLSKKSQQNGSLQSSKKSSNQKSNVESSVSILIVNYIYLVIYHKKRINHTIFLII